MVSESWFIRWFGVSGIGEIGEVGEIGFGLVPGFGAVGEIYYMLPERLRIELGT